ncbi:MAG: DUF6531 domain-containing protein, partial [Candidatus Poribacteria bacterium]|nr:DUF6531 domain-containing protein [Candidatus Poribacteria bacterium]
MKGLFCLVLLSTSLLLWLCGLTDAQELTIANYHLVMGERVGRTTFNYTYRATVTNAGADAQNVTAIVTSTSSDTVVVEGLLTFGSVPAGSTIQSIDTFTIRHDRQVLFAPDVLVVEFQSERVLTRIVETSPANGEGDVAVTRETILRFSRPLADSAVVDAGVLFAEFGGQPLAARHHISPDRRTVTMFYEPPLPSSARVRVTLIGDNLRDRDGNPIDVSDDDQPGGVRTIDFETLSLTILEGTSICGRVFASQLNDEGMNVPLEGVTITVDGMEDELRAVTDDMGNFRLELAPVGRFFVHIDGRTVIEATIDGQKVPTRFPSGPYYPLVGKAWEAIPGEEINIGNIHLPLIQADTLQPTSMTEETVLTFDEEFIAENPDFANLEVRIPPDSLYADDGTRGGLIGIAPVAADRLPGPLPEGLELRDVVTIQTDGATNFDVPVPVCFPNYQNLEPGEKSALFSFNHDTGRFEVVGSMTVTEDGTQVCTDEGVGIIAPGWHAQNPNSTGGGGPYGTGGGSDDGREPPNGQPGDATDPIYLYSGEFYQSIEDLRIPGRGTDFTWIRKYRSKIGPNTAQGNGWDYSYNVWIESSDDDIVLRNGNSRVDRYRLQPDGSYSRDGFFRNLVKNPDGSYTLTFEDTGMWVFHPLDSTPPAGKIVSIIDRNSNTLQFGYDANGRLQRITDSLDRDILVSYNANGFILEITDFAGRVIRYEYYDGTESGGNLGDLKSVTTPAVTGTPNGNDFPNGKTTTYTYSTGFADPRLNHNLLTITDGRRNDSNDPTFGQGPYLTNIYASTTAPDNINFDHVVRQIWGNPDDIIDIVYVSIFPTNRPTTTSNIIGHVHFKRPPGNGGAVMKTIVNDRNGNVKEYFYDSQNHMVRMREYTGRADPKQPTNALSNRPTGKLRPEDSDFFETIYEWNTDSLQKRIIYPNGNVYEYVYESDLNPKAPPRTRSNLRVFRQLPGIHQPAGDQDALEQFYEYDPRFGGAGYVTKRTDPRGNTTTYTYDENGNRIRTQHRIRRIVEEFEYNQFGQTAVYIAADNGSNHRRRDEYTYYDSGHQRGYLKNEIIDVPNFALTTTYEYDLVGNIIRLTDPRGNDVQYVFNSQNQVVQESSREVTKGAGVRYQRDFSYDANNNLTRVDIQNIDDQGVLQPNAHFTLTYDYEVLNHPIRVTEEVDENRTVIEEYAYDGNRNRTLTRYGEAFNANQPNNIRRTVYDERDLEFQIIRAPGDSLQSTTQYDYDRNGNFATVREGVEDRPRILSTTYDGFNRPVTTVDPLGNVTQSTYDANNNRIRIRIEGEVLDEPGDTANVRLSDVAYFYDEMDRLIRTESAFFDTETQRPIGDGLAVGQFFYNDINEITRLIDANSHDRRTIYDTANRVSQVIDAKGNIVSFDYDANDNVISAKGIEKSDLGLPDETFTTTFEYDELDRLIKEIDNIGNTHEYTYDSRD